MNRLSLFLGALVLAAALVPNVAQAQLTYCMTDAFGYAWTVTLNPTSDILVGDVQTGLDREAVGSRGTVNGQERRSVMLLAVSRSDPFWFQYNGLVSPAGGGTYSYSGDWISEIGGSGTFSGTFVPGACPAPRGDAQIDPNGPDAR